MKEKELRDYATCGVCGQKIGHTGLPFFYRVTVERFGIDMQAVKRQSGLEMMIGSSLAAVMGPDETLAKPIMKPVKFSVCENCSCEQVILAALAENHAKSEEQDAHPRSKFTREDTPYDAFGDHEPVVEKD